MRRSWDLTIETLAEGKTAFLREIGKVELLGHKGPLPFSREANELVVTLPETKLNEFAYTLKIQPA